jgi:predicted N-formylglutamate amidohydrolase
MIADELAEGYRIIGGHAAAGLVILCDHASNALPPGYSSLGLRPSEFERHIAYDIGAAAIAEHLARALGAPALFTRVSRLLIDPNRGVDDPTLIMQLSDGAVVPGNRNLSEMERQQRIARYYTPYHQAVARVVAACRAAGSASGREPMIFSVHSMTHAWKGASRPWHCSILWHNDFGFAAPLLSAFRADPNLFVGDNVPYAGGLEGDTLNQHAHPFRLPNAVIEYRQDLVADARGQQQWADRTVPILRRILEQQRSARPPLLKEPVMTKPAQNTSHPIANDAAAQTELEAAAFRRLMAHLRTRSDVQNIDLMNLAGFCRNCLSNWLQDAAKENGHEISKDAARAHVYGMPYKDWQAQHQREATPAQQSAFAATKPHGH